MSLQHWAIEAAWRNKAQRTVPGTSRHIIQELRNNLVVTRDGVVSFNQLLDSCAKSLNSIIDLVNAHDPDIISKIGLQAVLDRLPEVEDSFSRSSSSISRSSHLSSDGPIKMELNYTQSEKKSIPMESTPKKASRTNESSPDVVPFTTNEPLPPPDVSSRHQVAPPRTQDTQNFEELVPELHEEVVVKNDDVTISVAAPDASPIQVSNPTAEPKESTNTTIPKTFSPPTLKLKSSNATRATEGIANSFRFQSSPKTITSTSVLPSASLVVDTRDRLSLPAASHADRLHVGASSELEMSPVQLNPTTGPITSPTANLSFIPLAKSINPDKFTTPSVQNTTNSDSDDDISFKEISTAIRKSFAGNASMARLTTINSNHKVEQGEKTTVFVKREPVKVKVEPTRQSIVSKSKSSTAKPRRTLEHSKRTSVFVSLPEREPISFRSSLGHSILVKIEEDSRPQKELKVAQDNLSNSKADQPEVAIQAPNNGTSSSLNMHSTNLNKKAVSLRKPSPSLQVPTSPGTNGALSNGKSKNRTTANGSPRRVELPSLRKEIRPEVHRSTKRPSPDLSKTSPTKRAWRSPTADSNQVPSNASVSINPEVRSPRRSPRKSNGIVNGSASGSVPRTKSSGNKNKFLVTKLNPNNPPTFVPSKNSDHKVSPKKVARTTFNNVPDLQVVSAQNHKSPSSLKSQFNSVSLLNNKLDLSLSSHSNSTTQHTKLVRSPRRPDSSKDSKPKSIASGFSGSHLSKVAPRRKAVGNAVPLPDAARGNFVRERSKGTSISKDQKTPQRRLGLKSEVRTSLRSRSSPSLTRDELPDVPSDDEVLRRTKHLKSWADTPEIIRVLNEKPQPDPRAVFGEIPILNIDDVFSSVSPSKNYDHS